MLEVLYAVQLSTICFASSMSLEGDVLADQEAMCVRKHLLQHDRWLCVWRFARISASFLGRTTYNNVQYAAACSRRSQSNVALCCVVTRLPSWWIDRPMIYYRATLCCRGVCYMTLCPSVSPSVCPGPCRVRVKELRPPKILEHFKYKFVLLKLLKDRGFSCQSDTMQLCLSLFKRNGRNSTLCKTTSLVGLSVIFVANVSHLQTTMDKFCDKFWQNFTTYIRWRPNEDACANLSTHAAYSVFQTLSGALSCWKMKNLLGPI